ncbi:MAG: AbrB/MazE/SpoVT family DNA-binding domain-containing protein [Pseudomonadota bacterium]
MSTAIDFAGRLVIPKAVRDAAGIAPGTPLEVRYRDGRIEIEPAPLDIKIETVGGVAVASPSSPVPVLSADTVTATRDRLREERG